MRKQLLLGLLLVCSLGAAFAATASGSVGHTASATPTLGVANRSATGFGKVKPKLVSFNGDGESFVKDVHWRSWGGRRAIGHGKAHWVWPDWCSACGSVTLRATVVAFDRSNCDGHRVYKWVEWFFPSRGMRFSRGLAFRNLCTWKFKPDGPHKPHRCKAVDLPRAPGSPPGLAEKIKTYYGRIKCSKVRHFLRVSRVMHHYGHNARFHHHRWWCGSQLGMQLTPRPPQDFSCGRGDYLELDFSIRKR